MSNTRHAKEGSTFRQERYASSPEFERGLLGNLVARRCTLLDSAADQDLVWWMQLISWQPGGLAKLAADLIAAYPDRLASPSMRKFGCKAGQVYSAEKTRAVHRDFNAVTDADIRSLLAIDSFSGEDEDYKPTPAAEFVAECRRLAGRELEAMLSKICVKDAIGLAEFSPAYFPDLIPTLREYQSRQASALRSAHVVTALGQQLWETLDYCQQSRCMVLIDGLARTGKTFSARAWCDLHPGTARYVQCPSSNDDTGFFKAIARALGVSISRNSKAIQLRDRCEEVLQQGHLTLVLDEAHYCWPQSSYRAALPNRINWIMTALVNNGVPVALVTTPQFMRVQKGVEQKSSWTSEQFTGRIGHYQKLPDSLSADDLAAVAKNLLPEGCEKSIEWLVNYAQGSAKYLAAIESVVRRARYLAGKENRSKVAYADIRAATKESVIPSDNALHAALIAPSNKRRAGTIPAPLKPSETEFQRPLMDRENAGARAQDLTVLETAHADRARGKAIAA